MTADNKMWEGHRIIYPDLRDEFVKTKEQPFLHPTLDEQNLEILGRKLSLALASKSPVTLVIWSNKSAYEKEVVILKKEAKQKGPSLRCRDKAGDIIYIPLYDIIDIQIYTGDKPA